MTAVLYKQHESLSMLLCTIRLRMKLLLVTATAIAVFTVDCQDFSIEPEGLATDNKVQLFPEETEGLGKAQNILDGNIFAVNQDSDNDDHQMKEVEMEQHRIKLRRSKCKARNACVVMGGFCVTNATLCDGRLVPEGCKGTNCQCCVPGKEDKENFQNLLKDFESMKNNLTQANLKIEMELQSLRDNQNNISDTDTKLKNLILTKMENITDGGKQLKMELNVVRENISNGNLQLKEELQSIIDHQINITDTDANLKIELQSLMANITDSNSGLKTDVNSMKNDMTSYNSNTVSKMNSIDTKLNTIGAAIVTGRLAHFPYATHKKNWVDAKAYCESIGGQIWTPIDRAETIAVYKICGTLCWNGWHKNSGGVWVTGTGVVRNSNFWGSASEPGSSDDAAWSDSNGLWGRGKTNLYGWTCQM